MKKMFMAFVLLNSMLSISNAQMAAENTASIQTFEVGGTTIAIPAPKTQMSEMGDNYRPMMEFFVPDNNRLIAAFLMNSDLRKLTSGSAEIDLSQYAMVQVSRRAEFADCGPNEFKTVTGGFNESLGSVLGSALSDVEEDVNRRLKSLDLPDASVSLGAPIQLGCLFSKQDAYSFGMMAPVSIGDETRTMAVGAVLLRVKQRIVFAYLNCEYKNEGTVKWLRTATERWADAILKANQS